MDSSCSDKARDYDSDSSFAYRDQGPGIITRPKFTDLPLHPGDPPASVCKHSPQAMLVSYYRKRARRL